MNRLISAGIWPTMITPFNEDNEVDYDALEILIEWYISQGVHGLFAICQSSEIFFLSLEERMKIARFVTQQTAGRIPVIASGSISETLLDIVYETEEMAATGVDAVVLLTSRLAGEDEGEDAWQKNAEEILSILPEHIQLGLYECPHPYKRLLSPELLAWLASTNRFAFLKDTSCSLHDMKKKLEAVKNTSLKIYNANSATLLDSLKIGISGFSGVMTNFHSDLYVWLYSNWQTHPQEAKKLADFLGVSSLIERQMYPVNAKYHLQLSGVPITLHSRWCEAADFTPALKKEVEQLYSLAEDIKKGINLSSKQFNPTINK